MQSMTIPQIILRIYQLQKEINNLAEIMAAEIAKLDQENQQLRAKPEEKPA